VCSKAAYYNDLRGKVHDFPGQSGRLLHSAMVALEKPGVVSQSAGWFRLHNRVINQGEPAVS
jgi:hypothetical protein